MPSRCCTTTRATGRWGSSNPEPTVRPGRRWPTTPVLLIFLDGVGLGPDAADRNAFSGADLPALTALAGGQQPVLAADGAAPRPPLYALDARLGVAGLPQSGTGQTALLTGVNAAALLGQHQGPYPGPALRPLLARRSVWAELLADGRRVAYANAFPDRYLERAVRGTARMGAIARSAELAGVRLRGPAELRAGHAVSAFLTNDGWREHLGVTGLPEIDRATAGGNLARLAAAHDFTMFEYYATDIAGHRADVAGARATLEQFDQFLGGVMACWPTGVLALASDHGNIEDMGTGRHTTNAALGVWAGAAPAVRPASLMDLLPNIMAATAA